MYMIEKKTSICGNFNHLSSANFRQISNNAPQVQEVTYDFFWANFHHNHKSTCSIQKQKSIVWHDIL